MKVKKIEEVIIEEARKLNKTNPDKNQCATQAVMDILSAEEMCQFATMYDITMDHIIEWVEKELEVDPDIDPNKGDEQQC